MPPSNDQEISAIRKDMIATFSTEQGDKVLRWLVHRCEFDSTVRCFDPYEAMFREGRRSIIVDILNAMRKTTLTNVKELLSELEQPVYEVTEAGDTDA